MSSDTAFLGALNLAPGTRPAAVVRASDIQVGTLFRGRFASPTGNFITAIRAKNGFLNVEEMKVYVWEEYAMGTGVVYDFHLLGEVQFTLVGV